MVWDRGLAVRLGSALVLLFRNKSIPQAEPHNISPLCILPWVGLKWCVVMCRSWHCCVLYQPVLTDSISVVHALVLLQCQMRNIDFWFKKKKTTDHWQSHKLNGDRQKDPGHGCMEKIAHLWMVLCPSLFIPFLEVLMTSCLESLRWFSIFPLVPLLCAGIDKRVSYILIASI